MKRSIIFLWFAIPLFCMAQNPLSRYYEYDNAGNRVLRKKIEMRPLLSPPPPQDSTNYTESGQYYFPEPQTTLPPLETFSSLESAPAAEPYFLETLSQTAIKIYPNPTTEKVTMEISGWETLQTGIFKLYSLTGQLLQEQPVHSLTTTISLSNLPKGAYILKVYINDQTEDWRIIKN